MTDLSTEISEFRNKKPKNVALIIAVEFYHPLTGVIRIVDGFSDKDLGIEALAPRNGGETVSFRAAYLDAPWPSQSEEPTVNVNITLPRVGSEIKSELKKIVGFGAFDPIEVVWRAYLSSNLETPVTAYYLYGSASLDSQNATINASDVNPLSQRVSRILTTTDFPGTIDL